jgi:regulator of replication initiation timing
MSDIELLGAEEKIRELHAEIERLDAITNQAIGELRAENERLQAQLMQYAAAETIIRDLRRHIVELEDPHYLKGREAEIERLMEAELLRATEMVELERQIHQREAEIERLVSIVAARNDENGLLRAEVERLQELLTPRLGQADGAAGG